MSAHVIELAVMDVTSIDLSMLTVSMADMTVNRAWPALSGDRKSLT
jgi:hypothetical protein